MRSDVEHLAKCGKESLYYCRMSRDICPKFHPNCTFKPKTLTTTRQANPIHPLVIDLSESYMQAVGLGFFSTAWCIDLAKTAIGWELAGKEDIFVQNKIKEKVLKDKYGNGG